MEEQSTFGLMDEMDVADLAHELLIVGEEIARLKGKVEVKSAWSEEIKRRLGQ